MSDINPCVQIVVSTLKPTTTRAEFLELHRLTAEWMRAHPECASYEVFEGAEGAVADRIVWKSKAGALRGNQDYARSDLAKDMERIIGGYRNFFGTPVNFESTVGGKA